MDVVILKQAKRELGDAIYVLHAATKKKQKIDRKTEELLKTRIRSIGL